MAPLHLAAERNSVNVAELLIRSGADVNASMGYVSSSSRLNPTFHYLHFKLSIMALMLVLS